VAHLSATVPSTGPTCRHRPPTWQPCHGPIETRPPPIAARAGIRTRVPTGQSGASLSEASTSSVAAHRAALEPEPERRSCRHEATERRCHFLCGEPTDRHGPSDDVAPPPALPHVVSSPWTRWSVAVSQREVTGRRPGLPRSQRSALTVHRVRR
jgi:hypothetical protein